MILAAGACTLAARRVCLALCVIGAAGCTVGTRPLGTDANDASLAAPPDAGVVLRRCLGGGTEGRPCETAAQCDDLCYCNGIEACESGFCVPGASPCETHSECADSVCDEAARACDLVARDERCDDGNACDGAERCDPYGGCIEVAPLACSDGDACTVDRCDPRSGCVHEPRDRDGDGFIDVGCGGNDCDDAPGFGSAIHPGAEEICFNLVDDDCDGYEDVFDLRCRSEAPNDTCDSVLMLPGSGRYTLPLAARGLDHPYCLSSIPRFMDEAFDVVYGLSLSETSTVDLRTVGGHTRGVALVPMSDCAGGPFLECDISTWVYWGNEQGWIHRDGVPPGTYAVIVWKVTSTLSYLDVRIGPADPSVCETSVLLDADAALSGDGSAAVVIGDASELRPPRRGVPFRLTVASATTVTFRTQVANNTIPASIPGQISIFDDCADLQSARAAEWAGIEGHWSGVGPLSIPLEAGTYFGLLEVPIEGAAADPSRDELVWELRAELRPM